MQLLYVLFLKGGVEAKTRSLAYTKPCEISESAFEFSKDACNIYSLVFKLFIYLFDFFFAP